MARTENLYMKIRKCRCANAVGLKVDFLIRTWAIDDVHIERLGKFHSFNVYKCNNS